MFREYFISPIEIKRSKMCKMVQFNEIGEINRQYGPSYSTSMKYSCTFEVYTVAASLRYIYTCRELHTYSTSYRYTIEVATSTRYIHICTHTL
jgi:hypothetical protein